MNFSWAMDLDPKGANNQIKEAIDKRYVNDEDEPATGGCKLHVVLPCNTIEATCDASGA